MGSKRFPGKCMHKIGKFPLVCYTYVQSVLTGYVSMVVTPDEEIQDELLNNRRIPCLLTSNRPINGSERCAEALANEIFNTMGNKDIIIDVQGDMVKFDHTAINELVSLLSSEKVEFATVFSSLPDSSYTNPNRVKCSIKYDDKLKTLLVDDFSRNPIPNRENYLHVGIYGFTKESLNRYYQWSPSKNELTIRLEQMRIVDNNFPIGGVMTTEIPIAIDCLADVCLAEKEIKGDFECSMFI